MFAVACLYGYCCILLRLIVHNIYTNLLYLLSWTLDILMPQVCTRDHDSSHTAAGNIGGVLEIRIENWIHHFSLSIPLYLYPIAHSHHG